MYTRSGTQESPWAATLRVMWSWRAAATTAPASATSTSTRERSGCRAAPRPTAAQGTDGSRRSTRVRGSPLRRSWDSVCRRDSASPRSTAAKQRNSTRQYRPPTPPVRTSTRSATNCQSARRRWVMRPRTRSRSSSTATGHTEPGGHPTRASAWRPPAHARTSRGSGRGAPTPQTSRLA